MSEYLTVEEVLLHAEMLDRNMDALERSAPKTVAALGGRDGLAKMCETTCIGPIPRIDAETWARMSLEYEDNREHASTNRG